MAHFSLATHHLRSGGPPRMLTNLKWGPDVKSKLEQTSRDRAVQVAQWLQQEEVRTVSEMRMYDQQRADALAARKSKKKQAEYDRMDDHGPVSDILGGHGGDETAWWQGDIEREKEGHSGWEDLGMAQLRWDVARAVNAGPFSSGGAQQSRYCTRPSSAQAMVQGGPAAQRKMLSQRMREYLSRIPEPSARVGQLGADPQLAQMGYPICPPGQDRITRRDVSTVLRHVMGIKPQAGGPCSGAIGSTLNLLNG